MSLAENPEIRESGGHLRNERKSLRALRDWKSGPTETAEKFRALCVGCFEPQRTRREFSPQAAAGRGCTKKMLKMKSAPQSLLKTKGQKNAPQELFKISKLN
jgi:hypothetical protein